MFVFPLITYALTGSALLAAAAEALHLLGLVGMLLPARRARRPPRPAPDDAARQRRGRRCSTPRSPPPAIAGALTRPAPAGGRAADRVAAGLFSPAEISAVRTVVPTRGAADRAEPEPGPPARGRRWSAHPSAACCYGVTRWLPFVADAVSYAVTWVLLGRIRTDLSPAPYDGPRRRPGHDLAEGVRFTWSRPFFRVLHDLVAADQPGGQRAVLRGGAAADRRRLPAGPDRPGRGGRRASAGILGARRRRRGSSTGSPPGG